MTTVDKAELQKIAQQVVTVRRQNRFRVKLHPKDGVFPMCDAHDLAVIGPRRDFKTIRQRGFFHHQRVISRRLKRSGYVIEDALALMLDHRGFAVHQPGCPDNGPAIGLRDTLMAQTHPENRNA